MTDIQDALKWSKEYHLKLIASVIDWAIKETNALWRLKAP